MSDGREMVRALHGVEAESRRRIEEQVRRLSPEEIADMNIAPPKKPRRIHWVDARK